MKNLEALYKHFVAHRSISTDTRHITPGSIFFALKGEKFDGNRFAREALDRGASLAVVSDPQLTGDQFFFVEDTLVALQKLANHHRHTLTIPVLAITGSNGKTTTKELITAVLAKKYKVHATAGNLNNHIGVPLTLLATPTNAEIVICEMGANHVGEIAALCRIAEPGYGLITNIGKAHLEGFGSLEGVKKGKGELYDFLALNHGTAFVNTDDPRLLEISAKLPVKVTYGMQSPPIPDVHFNLISGPGDTGIRLENSTTGLMITSPLYGHYNAINIIAAFTVGQYFNVGTKEMQEAIGTFVSGANRSEITHYHKTTIVKDAYNANPSSMEAAIKTFAARHPHGWLVLGDMKEGGAESPHAHSEMLQLCASFSFERIYLVGSAFHEAYTAKAEKDLRMTPYTDIHALKAAWDWNACEGKALLLKGSRSMQLEKLIEP